MMLIFDQYRPTHPGDKDLNWAVGETGRTSFVWTITPKWTEFNGRYDLVEDHYFCIFKWTDPLWSALDIMIDEDFILFLRDSHSRKQYNQYYQGQDFDYLMAPPGVEERPLPLGNHVISVCMAAGILQEKPKGCFSLRADWSNKPRWQLIDAVTEALQNYLEQEKVTREQIENHPRYLEKKAMSDRHFDKILNRYVKMIWDKADVSQMNDIPHSDLFCDLIKKRLKGNMPTGSKKEARRIVRETWKKVRNDILNRIRKKREQYFTAGHKMTADKDAIQKLVLEARQEVLRELEAELKTNDSK